MSDAVKLAQGLRDWEEENPWKSVALGFVPGIGSALGGADAAAAWIDPRADNWDKALATAGVLPIPIGKIVKALRGKKSLPEGALGINTAHGGTSVIERPDPGRVGEGEGNITEGPGFYTTTDLIHEPMEYADTQLGRDQNNFMGELSDLDAPEGFVNYYDIPDRDLPQYYDKHGRDVDLQSGKAVKSVYDFMREYRPEHFDDVMTTIDPTIRKMVKEGADAHDIERKIQEEAMKKFHQEVMWGEFRKPVTRENRSALQRTREELLASGLKGFKASTKQNRYGEYLQGTMTGSEQDYLVAMDPNRIQFLGAEALTDVKPRTAAIRTGEFLKDTLENGTPQFVDPKTYRDTLRKLESVNVDLIPVKPVGDHIQSLIKELRSYESQIPTRARKTMAVPRKPSKSNEDFLINTTSDLQPYTPDPEIEALFSTNKMSLQELDALVKNMDEAFKGLKK